MPVQDGAQPEKPRRAKRERGYGKLLPGEGMPSHKPPPLLGPSQQTLQDGDTLLAHTVVTPSRDTTESTESLMHTPKMDRAGDTNNQHQHLHQHSCCCWGRVGNKRGHGDPTAPHSSGVETQATTLPSSPSVSSFSPGQEKIKLQCKSREVHAASLQHLTPSTQPPLLR